jgi:outer membrane lipoprotein SlyB
MTRFDTLAFFVAMAAALGGCTPDYSPNTYDSAAMQQANKVDEGIVIGYREVKISDDGTIGTVTGGAAGGILGAETDSPTIPTALTALGGSVVGGIVGATVQHVAGDTTGWEYIVRETKGDLVSVTQRQPKPIPIGQKVLVIEGKQARIVPDYASTALDTPPPAADKAKPKASNSTVSAVAVTPVAAVPAAAPSALASTPPSSASSSASSSTPASAAAPTAAAGKASGASPPTAATAQPVPSASDGSTTAKGSP